MSRLRLFLACVLLAALPLQGYAAAAMLFCGPAAIGSMGHADRADRAGHRGHADHAGHAGHGAPESATPPHDHAQHSHEGHDSGVRDAPSDADHACSVCAACSHSVALAGTPQVMSAPAVPQASGAEPFSAFPTRAIRVPDKPPRA